VSLVHADTETTALAKINTAIAGNAALAATGIKAQDNGSGSIELVGKADRASRLRPRATPAMRWASAPTAPAARRSRPGRRDASAAGGAQSFQISLNGGASINLGSLTGTGTEAQDLSTLNAAFSANAALSAAASRLSIPRPAATSPFQSTNGTSFRINAVGANDAFGFGASASAVSSTGSTSSAYAAQDGVQSAGAQQAENSTGNGVYQFTGLTNTGDAQTVTLSAVDASGAQHTLNVNLTTSNASTLDQALSTINTAISASNDTTLEQIGAFKQQGTAGTPTALEGISFMSAGGQFKVSLGASPASRCPGVSAGIADPTSRTERRRAYSPRQPTAPVPRRTSSNVATATAAVSALATAVSKLGTAQAAVGKRRKQPDLRINLASSQLTNLAASESSIRDANMATESANLTKSQIQLQAGIAALSQANSAPQQILTLLQH